MKAAKDLIPKLFNWVKFKETYDLSEIELKLEDCQQVEQLQLLNRQMKRYLQEKELLHIFQDRKRIVNIDYVKFELIDAVITADAPRSRNVMLGCSANGDLLDTKIIDQESIDVYIKSVLIPYLEENEVEFPVILIVDPQRIKLTWNTFKLCKEKEIFLFSPYSSFNQVVQPFEVAVADVVDSYWKFYMDRKIEEQKSRAVRLCLSMMIEEFFEENVCQEYVRFAFKVCGIYPFDSTKIDFENLINCCRKRTIQRDAPKTRNFII